MSSINLIFRDFNVPRDKYIFMTYTELYFCAVRQKKVALQILNVIKGLHRSGCPIWERKTQQEYDDNGNGEHGLLA